MAGQDLALEPVGDDDEDSFGPIAYLSNPEDEPGRMLEHEQSERLRSEGLERALGQPRSAQPPDHRGALAARAGYRSRCTTWPTNSVYPPSASARSKAQAMKKMRSLIPALLEHLDVPTNNAAFGRRFRFCANLNVSAALLVAEARLTLRTTSAAARCRARTRPRPARSSHSKRSRPCRVEHVASRTK